MSDYSWLETCPDGKLEELQKIAASRVAFRNIPAWRRLTLAVALAIPLLASLAVTINVFMRASQTEQFMALVGCGIGFAVWTLSREARRRREFLLVVQAELERRRN